MLKQLSQYYTMKGKSRGVKIVRCNLKSSSFFEHHIRDTRLLPYPLSRFELGDVAFTKCVILAV